MRNRDVESDDVMSEINSSDAESWFSPVATDTAPSESTKVDSTYLIPAEVRCGNDSTCETESTISSLETLIDPTAPTNIIATTSPFCVGDHVYTWCSLLGLPRAYQHHGIVVHVSQHYVKIIDFYPLVDDDDVVSGKSSARTSGMGSKGRMFCMSEVILDHTTACREWKHVQYNVTWTNRILRRSGTYSTAVPDALGFILSRIEFLHEHGYAVLPPYDELLSNCECVAVWCKTGRFCSLQGSALLGAAVNHSLKATAAAGFGAATATTTVPCAGVWGWIGFTTTVPLTTAVPFLLPAILAGGAASAIPPIVILQRCKQEWKSITETLNVCLAQGCSEGLYLPHVPRFQSL